MVGKGSWGRGRGRWRWRGSSRLVRRPKGLGVVVGDLWWKHWDSDMLLRRVEGSLGRRRWGVIGDLRLISGAWDQVEEIRLRLDSLWPSEQFCSGHGGGYYERYQWLMSVHSNPVRGREGMSWNELEWKLEINKDWIGSWSRAKSGHSVHFNHNVSGYFDCIVYTSELFHFIYGLTQSIFSEICNILYSKTPKFIRLDNLLLTISSFSAFVWRHSTFMIAWHFT